jgi:hypothetical protein
LYNGLQSSWNTNGWFTFDQTDDYALNTTSQFQSSSGTIIVTCYPNSGLDNDYIAGVGGDFTIGGSRAIGVISNVWWLVSYGSGVQDFVTSFSVNYNRWSQVAYIWDNTTSVTASVNGQFQSTTKTLVTPSGTNFTLGRPPWNDAALTWGGNLSKVQFYPKALTQAEMLQNYYGGPIVTNGLVFAVDAGNLVSYPKSGTSTYNLTGSGATGTLTNGTSFTPLDGGAFVFDGTNDYISFPNDTNLDNQALTMESWNFLNTTTSQNAFLFEKGFVNTQYSNFYDNSGNFYFRTMGLSNPDLTFTTSTYISPNTWNHVVCTYGAGVKTIYVNGIQVAQQTGLTGTISTNTTGLFLGAYGIGGYPLNGKIAESRVYNRALTAAEVLQNYNATK